MGGQGGQDGADVFPEYLEEVMSVGAKPEVRRDHWCLDLDQPPKSGESRIYVRNEGQDLVENPLPHLTSVQQLFNRGMKLFPTVESCGTLKRRDDGSLYFEYITLGEMGEMCRDMAVGLSALGMRPRDRIAIYSINRLEWSIADWCCTFYSFVNVPLYDTLGDESMKYIINHADIRFLCVSKDKMRQSIEMLSVCPNLKFVIQMEDLEDSDYTEAKAKHPNVRFLDFRSVRALGSRQRELNEFPPFETALTDDVYTIVYTSGTTGIPKGVVLTNGNILSAVGGALANGLWGTTNDSYFSFLPLAHILERVVHVVGVFYGGRLGYYSGDLTNLVDEIRAFRPTIFFGVPRLYNKIYQGILEQVSTMPVHRRYLFHWALETKIARLERGLASKYLDALVFRKTKAALGGRIRLMVTGSAPLSARVHRFLQACFCCPVLAGYGLTEAYPVALSRSDDWEPVQVGRPMSHIQLKLRDAPEMGYFTTDTPNPRGEVLVRGPSVFQGYFKRPELNSELFTEDRFFCTGDVGEIISGGRLLIIDRIRNLFKLSQGEFVSAEKLENLYVISRYVSMVWVHGDASRDFVVAIVVPVESAVMRWAASQGIHSCTFAELCERKDVKQEILRSMDAVVKKAGVAGFERVRAIHLFPEEFSMENGLTTPTQKLRRGVLKEQFKSVIDDLYSQ